MLKKAKLFHNYEGTLKFATNVGDTRPDLSNVSQMSVKSATRYVALDGGSPMSILRNSNVACP